VGCEGSGAGKLLTAVMTNEIAKARSLSDLRRSAWRACRALNPARYGIVPTHAARRKLFRADQGSASSAASNFATIAPPWRSPTR